MPAQTIVVVFLRGGADGLALVPPMDDPTLRRLRPTLASRRPIPLGPSLCPSGETGSCPELGLHPELAPLVPAFRAGELAIVHAVGSDDATRSHFDAQERMERAGVRAGSEPSGWLARHLRTRVGPEPSTLSSVAIGTSVPDSLASAPAVAVLESVDDLVASATTRDPALRRALAALHGDAHDPIHEAGRDAMAAIDRLARTRPTRRSRAYGALPFGRALAEVARLVRADVGLEAATIDLGGWDTHLAQSTALDTPARTLAEGLAAFRADLGDAMEHVVVVVMTELGRRAYENAALGTDHGRASVMLLLGGGVRGGRVVTRWPGLDPASLEPPGDLRVTIDYRDVLAELVGVRLGNTRVGEVFPGWAPGALGLFGST